MSEASCAGCGRLARACSCLQHARAAALGAPLARDTTGDVAGLITRDPGEQLLARAQEALGRLMLEAPYPAQPGEHDAPALAANALARLLEGATSRLQGLDLRQLTTHSGEAQRVVRTGLSLLHNRRLPEAAEWWALQREAVGERDPHLALACALLAQLTHTLAGDRDQAARWRDAILQDPLYQKLHNRPVEDA